MRPSAYIPGLLPHECCILLALPRKRNSVDHRKLRTLIQFSELQTNMIAPDAPAVSDRPPAVMADRTILGMDVEFRATLIVQEHFIANVGFSITPKPLMMPETRSAVVIGPYQHLVELIGSSGMSTTGTPDIG